MLKKSIFCLILASLLCSVSPVSAQDDDVTLPPKTDSEYWVIRSRAVSELITFLTKKRSDLNTDLNHFSNFMEKVGKTEDFATATIEVPDDPKLRWAMLGIIDSLKDADMDIPQKKLSWEEMIEIGMKFMVLEGYLPVDFKDGEELGRFKKVLKNREKFLRDVRKDVSDQVEAGLRAWFYLGTINQQKAFKVFMFQEEEAQRQAQQAKHDAARSERADKARDERDQRRQEELQRRQDRLNQSYGYGYW